MDDTNTGHPAELNEAASLQNHEELGSAKVGGVRLVKSPLPCWADLIGVGSLPTNLTHV